MKIRIVLAMLFGASFAMPIRAEEPRLPLPADLAAVPADALGFVHIRVADIWKSDILKDFRDTVLKAGTKALEGFDARFLPAPSSIDRLTIVMVPRGPELRLMPHFLGILAVNKPLDQETILKNALPKAVEKKTTNGSYFADEKSGLAVFFIKNQVIVFGETPVIEKYVDQRSKPITEMVDALDAANSKRHITVAANINMIPDELMDEFPDQVRPLLLAKHAIVSLDLAENSQIDLVLRFRDDRLCSAGNLALQNLAKKGRNEIKKAREELLRDILGDGKIGPLEELPEATLALIALGTFERIDEILANPPIKREGNTLLASVKISSGSGPVGVAATGAGLLLPAVQKVRESAARAKSANNLKQIGLALHMYHNDYGDFPAAAICDKNGKPLLSWRVAILPYIDQDDLYKRFKLDEPWDSAANKKLIPLMPNVYLHLDMPNKELGITHYRISYGDEAMFDLKQSRTIADITDGTSNTMMAFEAAEGVPWTKPEEFKYDPKKPLPKFASLKGGGFNVLFADGSVQRLKDNTPEEILRAIITAAGAEEIDLDKHTVK